MRSKASTVAGRAIAILAVLLAAAGGTACGRVTAGRSEPQADPPAWVSERALAQAGAMGDPDPTSIEWALTDAATVAPIVGTTGGDPAQQEYLVIMTGKFVDTHPYGPVDQPPPSGSVLIVTLDLATHWSAPGFGSTLYEGAASG